VIRLRVKKLLAGQLITPIFVVLFSAIVFLYNVNGIQNYYFNSDTLYGIEITRDFIASPLSIHNWLVPQAPFVFPDLFLLFPATYLNFSPYIIFLSAFLLQTLITVLLLREISKLLIPQINRSFVDCLILLSFATAITYPEPARLMLSMEWHHGNSIGILLVTYMILKNQTPNLVLRKSLMLIFAFLLGLSDSFFLLQFSLPLLLVHIIMRLKRRKGLSSDAFMFLIALTSYLGYRSIKLFFWNSPRQPIKFEFGEFASDFAKIFELFYQASPQIPFFLGLGVAILIPLETLIKARKKYLTSDKAETNLQDKTDVLIFTSLLFRISFVLTIIVICLIPGLDPGYRYFSYFSIFGFYWAGLFLYALFEEMNFTVRNFSRAMLGRMRPIKKFWEISRILCFAISLSLVLIAVPSGAKIVSAPYTSTSECLDNQITENKLVRGVSSYWLARYYSNFLNSKPEIVSVYSDLSAFLWITNWRDYDGNFDFVLIQNIGQDPFNVTSKSTSKILGLNKVHNCGEVTIVYGTNFSVQKPFGF
jgi:hypothetical protein